MPNGKDYYLVVFEGGGGDNGNYKGVITYTPYESKEEFDKSWKQRNTSDKILAEGVTNEKAQELVATTPFSAYLHAIVSECTKENASRR